MIRMIEKSCSSYWFWWPSQSLKHWFSGIFSSFFPPEMHTSEYRKRFGCQIVPRACQTLKNRLVHCTFNISFWIYDSFNKSTNLMRMMILFINRQMNYKIHPEIIWCQMNSSKTNKALNILCQTITDTQYQTESKLQLVLFEVPMTNKVITYDYGKFTSYFRHMA